MGCGSDAWGLACTTSAGPGCQDPSGPTHGAEIRRMAFPRVCVSSEAGPGKDLGDPIWVQRRSKLIKRAVGDERGCREGRPGSFRAHRGSKIRGYCKANLEHKQNPELHDANTWNCLQNEGRKAPHAVLHRDPLSWAAPLPPPQLPPWSSPRGAILSLT